MLTERDPDYVVLGETRTYSFEAITRAIRLIDGGARFIATNPDPTGPSPEGSLPATGSVAALITKATGVEPYFVGKPNPLMMRVGAQPHRRALRDHGDDRRPDGHRHHQRAWRPGLRTVLVLTGSTRRDEVGPFPYRPTRVVDSIADVVPLVDELDRPADRAGPAEALTAAPNHDGRGPR